MLKRPGRGQEFRIFANVLRRLPFIRHYVRTNTLITSDQNQNREFWIQLISGVYLIHNGIFYLINVLKLFMCVITINLRLM